MSEVSSVALAGLMFALIGMALDWSFGWSGLAAVSMAFATWASRSLSRAFYCLFASIGVVSAVVSAAILLHLPLADLGVTWTFVCVGFWLLVIGFGLLLRTADVDRDFGMMEIVGALMTTVFAALVAVRVDFSTNLLYLLIPSEDNAAWLFLTTAVQSSPVLGPGFGGNLGPVVPLLLGLIGWMQEPSIPRTNAAFAVYAFAAMLSPAIVTLTLRKIRGRGLVAFVCFPIVAIGWFWMAPERLTAMGHLSALLATISTIVAISYLVFERTRWLSSLVAIGVIFTMGAVWFPMLPLAVFLIVIVGLRMWRQGSAAHRVVLGLCGLGAVVVLYRQFQSAAFQFGLEKGLESIHEPLRILFTAGGGTATLDPLLLALIVVGVAGSQFLRTDSDTSVATLSRMLGVMLGYLVAVYALGAILEFGFRGYGPSKLTFVVGSVMLVMLVALVARISMTRRQLVVVLLMLLFGSLTWASMGGLLSRGWPGAGVSPPWLTPVLKIADSQMASGDNRSLGCLSADVWETYSCTRWAESLTSQGTGGFGPYRGAVVTNGDVASVVDGLVDSGAIADSALIILSIPDTSWALKLINNAGAVYNIEGEIVDARGPDFVWIPYAGARWATPGKAVLEAVRASPDESDVKEIVCYGSDPAEAAACSRFLTDQLGGTPTPFVQSLIDGAEQAVDTAVSDGSLSSIVLLGLDLPSASTALPYQRRLLDNVRAVYEANEDGSLRLVRADRGW